MKLISSGPLPFCKKYFFCFKNDNVGYVFVYIIQGRLRKTQQGFILASKKVKNCDMNCDFFNRAPYFFLRI